ncbi:hypothetical protein CsSME_00019103 [Camellia sinensis var. sinensis]
MMMISKKKKRGDAKEYDDDGDLIICRLSEKRRVTIQDFRGKTLVSMREYYRRDDKDLPTLKAVSFHYLIFEVWKIFISNGCYCGSALSCNFFAGT